MCRRGPLTLAGEVGLRGARREQGRDHSSGSFAQRVARELHARHGPENCTTRFARGLNSRVRRRSEELAHDLVECLRDVIPDRTRRAHAPVASNRLNGSVDRWALEEAAAGECFIEADPEREEVGALVRVARELLRREVPHLALHEARLGLAQLQRRTGEPEVENVRMPVEIDEHVRRAQIAVHQAGRRVVRVACRVQAVERFGDLGKQASSLIDREKALSLGKGGEQLFERHSVDPLEEQVVLPIDVAVLNQPREVLADDAGGDARLVDEHPGEDRIGRHIRRQPLQREAPLASHAYAKNLTHAGTRDALVELEASESGGSRRVHCRQYADRPLEARRSGQALVALDLPVRSMGINNAPMALTRDQKFAAFNALFSLVAVVFLAWLILVNRGAETSVDLSFVPALNACLNAASAVLLVAGVRAIKRGNRSLHMRLVISALTCSALFLVGYVTYHAVHGDTRYAGVGLIRSVYLTILLSHVLLSVTVLPLALTCLYLAFQERFDSHRRIARITFPIWLYVSVTGVIIYFMLRGSRG